MDTCFFIIDKGNERMNITEYIKLNIIPRKQPNLKLIYEDLMNLGYSPKNIYNTINEQLTENLNKVIEDYLKSKNDK
jgi:Holliday junction resolvasome RuvABC DNA-binding subunit